MKDRAVSVGLQIGTQPPLSALRAFLFGARAMRLDSIMVIDHFQNVFPPAIWDSELTWLATQRRTPNEFFDYQVLLGYLASRVGSMSLGVGVTEPIRRHPLLIAQAMMTLSHLTRHAPILGIGAGERMNLDPWRRAGSTHPFGERFNPLVDFIPDHYARRTMDEAIAAVPQAVLTEGPLLWGTLQQVTAKLRTFAEAGMRHVVLAPVSGLVSKPAALYGLWATGRIARSLRQNLVI